MHLQTVTKMVEVLEHLDKWVDETPPIEQPQRFGNKAYRIWFDRMKDVRFLNITYFISLLRCFIKDRQLQNAEALLKEALEEKYHKALVESTIYLVESFGNHTRIDYGTGKKKNHTLLT